MPWPATLQVPTDGLKTEPRGQSEDRGASGTIDTNRRYETRNSSWVNARHYFSLGTAQGSFLPRDLDP